MARMNHAPLRGVAVTARSSPRAPRPKDDPHAWIGDVIALVFWVLVALTLLVLLAFGVLRLVS
jgi:hypothetical protein